MQAKDCMLQVTKPWRVIMLLYALFANHHLLLLLQTHAVVVPVPMPVGHICVSISAVAAVIK